VKLVDILNIDTIPPVPFPMIRIHIQVQLCSQCPLAMLKAKPISPIL
jgi:hypothetical protein